MVECPTPDVPNLRRHEGPPPPYKYKYHVIFRCNDGFDLIGSDSVTCEMNGWSPPLPECEGMANVVLTHLFSEVSNDMPWTMLFLENKRKKILFLY